MTARRILFAPDSYGGFLTAPEAVAAAQSACPCWRGHPMADGGEGTLDALRWHRPRLIEHTAEVTGPDGSLRRARYLRDPEEGVLYAEAAEANGLRWVQDDPPRGLRYTSRGVGELLAEHLLPWGLPVRLGLGGSATVDGGMGAAEVLTEATELSAVTVWCDVRTPLAEACVRFGPQKGLTAEEIGEQSARLLAWAAELGGDPAVEGGGAAGGLGFFLAARGARLTAGAEAFAAVTGLAAAIRRAEVVVIGEGRLDDTSLEGKVAGTVLRLAQAEGRAVAALVGRRRGAAGALPGPVVEIRGETVSRLRSAAQALNAQIG